MSLTSYARTKFEQARNIGKSAFGINEEYSPIKSLGFQLARLPFQTESPQEIMPDMIMAQLTEKGWPLEGDHGLAPFLREAVTELVTITARESSERLGSYYPIFKALNDLAASKYPDGRSRPMMKFAVDYIRRNSDDLRMAVLSAPHVGLLKTSRQTVSSTPTPSAR